MSLISNQSDFLQKIIAAVGEIGVESVIDERDRGSWVRFIAWEGCCEKQCKDLDGQIFPSYMTLEQISHKHCKCSLEPFTPAFSQQPGEFQIEVVVDSTGQSESVERLKSSFEERLKSKLEGHT